MMAGAIPMRVILGRKPEQRRRAVSTLEFGGLSQAERQKAKWELRSQAFIEPVDPWRYEAQRQNPTPLRMLRSFGQPGRDAQRAWLLTDDHQEDSFRDKIVIKAPPRNGTSGCSDFVLKWALNFNYRSLFEVDRWLHLGDEAHIIGTDDVIVCYSSPYGKSFVLRAVASRRAVTVSFITNFGGLRDQNTQWDTLFWENLPLKSTSEPQGAERFSAMGQEYKNHILVTIEATTKRRADGWWVYLAITPIYELCGDQSF
ncbi:hypothetical protein QBC42DRAFT_277825 [Cladorrhinum samala]|uniref:Uncharacterized protein n=1 Tax=Cladorrhinum samala TaxID=585594 RepID=A0AAV9HG06_9PEZI|nr:hypothetical protein QBC42DRAFT_277825 [Cladorrhinum samala]